MFTANLSTPAKLVFSLSPNFIWRAGSLPCSLCLPTWKTLRPSYSPSFWPGISAYSLVQIPSLLQAFPHCNSPAWSLLLQNPVQFFSVSLHGHSEQALLALNAVLTVTLTLAEERYWKHRELEYPWDVMFSCHRLLCCHWTQKITNLSTQHFSKLSEYNLNILSS